MPLRRKYNVSSESDRNTADTASGEDSEKKTDEATPADPGAEISTGFSRAFLQAEDSPLTEPKAKDYAEPGEQWRATRLYHGKTRFPFTIQADGVIHADDIPAGRYRLEIELAAADRTTGPYWTHLAICLSKVCMVDLDFAPTAGAVRPPNDRNRVVLEALRAGYQPRIRCELIQ